MARRERAIAAWALLLAGACGPSNPPTQPLQSAAPASAASGPAPVTTAPSIRSIAVGRAHSCAALADGSVSCWGDNAFGQLGDGSQHTRPTPVRVRGLPSVRSIAASDDHTCAITDAGDVYCWGLVYGEWPELERGHGFETTPRRVEALENVSELALGKVFAAALAHDGSLFQWGGETRSSANDRSLSQRRSPSPSNLTGRYRHVGIGRSLLCATTSTGVSCARLYTNERGDDDLDFDCVGIAKADRGCQPFELGFDNPELVTIAQIDSRSPDYDAFLDDAVCAVGADGSFACARRIRTEAATEGGRWSRFEAVSAPPLRTAQAALALGRSDELFQISFSASSACSADGCKLRRLPLDELTRGGERVALGPGHSCVARGSSVVCWGDNASGQLGNGTRGVSSEPQLVKLGASETADKPVDIRERYAALRAKPSQKKLSGFGLVFANAELFEKADSEKSLGRLASYDDTLLAEQGEPRYLVSITEDRGERVGVRLVPKPKAENHCVGSLPLPTVALAGYVERSALAPVVSKRTRIPFDDDWLELLPGTPVYVDDHGRSALVFGERTQLEVPDGALGLSYALSQRRELLNEFNMELTLGSRIFKSFSGKSTNESERGEREDGTERLLIFHACTDAVTSSLRTDTLQAPVTEEREWGFGWVDPGEMASYPSGKPAGRVGDTLHLRADKLSGHGSQGCFRAIGEVTLCFPISHIHERRDE